MNRPRIPMLSMLRRQGGATCLEVGRKIQSYLDAEVDDRTASKIAGHLAACRRCGLDADAYRDIKQALGSRAALSSSAVAIERIRQFAMSLEARDEPNPSSHG